MKRYRVDISMPLEAWASATDFDPAITVGWDAEPAGRVSLDWGDGWARSGKSLLARVSSVIVPEEFNVLVNPRDAAIGTLRAHELRRWLYDYRFGG